MNDLVQYHDLAQTITRAVNRWRHHRDGWHGDYTGDPEETPPCWNCQHDAIAYCRKGLGLFMATVSARDAARQALPEPIGELVDAISTPLDANRWTVGNGDKAMVSTVEARLKEVRHDLPTVQNYEIRLFRMAPEEPTPESFPSWHRVNGFTPDLERTNWRLTMGQAMVCTDIERQSSRAAETARGSSGAGEEWRMWQGVQIVTYEADLRGPASPVGITLAETGEEAVEADASQS